MSTLIVVLPLDTPGAATPLDYVLSPDGRSLGTHDRAVATLLPAAREIVAVVPVQALSWHQVELPKGSLSRGALGSAAGTPRLRAMLEGLLEDRVLDDPADLHFALEPDARAQTPIWVASCNRQWLRASLALLESARRPAGRVVPELTPGTEALHILGTAAAPLLAVTGNHSVGVLPLSSAALDWARAQSPTPDDVPVLAEPALAAQAEQLGTGSLALRTSSERWLQASHADWDLAQFDLASSDRRRALQRTGRQALALLRAPQWRAARWGVGVLVAAHMVGINAWAWKETTALADKRAAVRGTLTSTFPGVKVVVDAPVQMQREIAQLRQAAGAYSQRDLEAMLGALGSALPPGQSLQSVEFLAGETRVRGLTLAADGTGPVNDKLRAFGLHAQAEGDRWVLRPSAAREVTP
jgi:general secretion pathway protein L